MTTANLAEALPRLQKLREVTGDAVCVTLDVWLHKSADDPIVKWSVYSAKYVSDGYGATLEAALSMAEAKFAFIPTSGLPEVVLP